MMNKQKGFTLQELVTIVAIVAIIAYHFILGGGA